MTGEIAAEVDEALLGAIQRLGRLMGSRQVSKRIREAAGIEVSQQGVQILRALHRMGELSIARLAAAADMDISAVSRQLGALETEGLVRRAATDTDGRVALVSLSRSGNKVAERIRSVGLAHLRDSLAGWSEDERRELARLLTRLVDEFVVTEVPSRQDVHS